MDWLQTFASSQVQSSVAVGVLHVDVSMGCKQCLHRRLKAAACCIVQGCCTVLRLQAQNMLKGGLPLIFRKPRLPRTPIALNLLRAICEKAKRHYRAVRLIIPGCRHQHWL